MTKLYHATPEPLIGHILEPRTIYEVSGKNNTYLFASQDKAHALTYTVTKGTRLMNAHIPETNMQILIVDSEELIGDPTLTGEIYEFESTQFERATFISDLSDQWVSKESVDLKNASCQKISSLNDLMQEGIQVYQVGYSSNFTAQTLYNTLPKSNSDFYAFLQNNISEKNLQWLNQERSINPENPFPTANNDISSKIGKSPHLSI